MSGERRPTIAVDCDDVVANINEAMRLFVNETYGANHTAEEYAVTGIYHRYWERVWGVPDGEPSDRFEQFVASGRMAHLEEVEGAIDSLTALKERYRLVMVTARGQKETDFTHTWLEAHAPDLFHTVTFMHLWDTPSKKATKADICQQTGAEYLIDDNFDHCRIAAELGVRALLFGDYGWNRAEQITENMARVKDWRDVKEYFDGRDKL